MDESTVSKFGAWKRSLNTVLGDTENSAQRLIRGGFEETIMSAAGPSLIPDVTSNFHIALERRNLSSLDEFALGDHSGAGFSMEGKSEYFSARVEEMMQSKSQFSSAVQHEIEHSRVHWSEVSGLSDSSEDDNDYEEVNRENEKVFAELMNDSQWIDQKSYHFFKEWPFLETLGRKIAEGGQAEIFDVMDIEGKLVPSVLVKVFKRGSCLSDLKKQWPCGVLRREVLCVVICGFLLDDGRFAFGMLKCWGDLRKLIDQAMQEKNNQGPPFPYEWSGVTLHAKDIMRRIANHMDVLHERGIIHRDLKAANILLHVNDEGLLILYVADFECSIGVVGTGFWRAPEILLALKNRSALDFSEKADVYSFGMICFEIVTGRLPFEGELEACTTSNDLVIEGLRPKLPSDLDVTLKDLIERCWNPIPSERPSFSEIIVILCSSYHVEKALYNAN